MLYPRKTLERFSIEHQLFQKHYKDTLGKMHAIMAERGAIRDVNTPIFHRRSPEDCLALAKHKILRGEAILSMMNKTDPTFKDLNNLIEECVDASNYLLFVATLCSMILEERDEDC